MDFDDALLGLTEAYRGVDDLVASLDRDDLLAATRCRGWVVADVVVHLLHDAQRLLVSLATPVPGPATVDFATYWRAFADSEGADHDPIPGIWSVKRSAAAYRDGHGGVVLWTETSPAAVRAAHAADPDGFIATQGFVLSTGDFLATLATEATIHHLDMVVNLPATPRPRPHALAVVCATLDGLAGHPRPRAWTDEDYILYATGRTPPAPPVAGYPLLS